MIRPEEEEVLKKKKCGGLKNPVGISHVTSASLLLLAERKKKKNAFHFFFVMPIEKSPFDFLGYVAHYNTWWNRGGEQQKSTSKKWSPPFFSRSIRSASSSFFLFSEGIKTHFLGCACVVGALWCIRQMITWYLSPQYTVAHILSAIRCIDKNSARIWRSCRQMVMKDIYHFEIHVVEYYSSIFP